MKIEYFNDTNTLLLEFSNHIVEETRDLNENTMVEFDSAGHLVSLTIEHAKQYADMEEFIFHPGSQSDHRIYRVAEEAAEYKTKKDSQ